MENLLIIKKIRPEQMAQEVDCLFERLQVKDRLTGRKTVFIKPNIFCREPSETGATVDLQLLGSVIDYFVGCGKNVFVGEAGANQYAQTSLFEDLGISPFCARHQAKFLNLNQTPCRSIDLTVDGKKVAFQVPVILLEPLFLVNLPKFKTHLSTRVSWAIKNLYGLLPDKEKWRGHQIGIHETLIGLSRFFQSDVVLMDGIVAMKGLGPTMGLPEQKNLLFGAPNHFIHDLGLYHLLKISNVPHIQKCLPDPELNIQYEFLGETGTPVDPQSLHYELSLPPLLFNRIFCNTNRLFFTLAPYMEKFVNPKAILNWMVHPKFVGLIRGVQKIFKI